MLLQPTDVNPSDPSQECPTLEDTIAAKEFQRRVLEEIQPIMHQVLAQTLPQALAEALPKALAQTLPQALSQALAPVKTTAARARNYQLVDGRFTPFVLVPFLNGDMPDQAPHNLPPLLKADSIRNLTAAEAAAYTNGYGLEPIRPDYDRKEAIGRYIGCIEDI